MNEQIKQLEKDALYFALQFRAGLNGDLTDYETEIIFREKFAELIVKECTKAVMDGTKEGDHYAQRIEQHFDNGTGGVLHFRIEECWCESCKPNTMTDMRMILCQICGNKRCPHATNHNNECTNSNEPGQKGSSWENYKV